MNTKFSETAEFYGLMNAFEKCYKKAPCYTKSIERCKKNSGSPAGQFYCDGETNAMFYMFLAGHSLGKCQHQN